MHRLIVAVFLGLGVVVLATLLVDGAAEGAAQPPATAPKTQRAIASAYGPGLYGNTTACGQTLRTGTVGVAHRSLRCGTRIGFRGRRGWVTARVIDRGPYAHGRTFDLTNGLVRKLGYRNAWAWGVRPVRYRRST